MKTFKEHLIDAGLLQDFIEVCDLDVTSKEVLQWCKRRPKLIETVRYWPGKTTIQTIRRELGRSAVEANKAVKRKRPGPNVLLQANKTYRHKVGAMAAGVGRKTPNRTSLDWEDPTNEQ